MSDLDQTIRRCYEHVERIEGRKPLVSLDRQHEIRQFQIELAALQFAFGLKLEASDDHTFEIIDTRREIGVLILGDHQGRRKAGDGGLGD